MDAPQDLGEQAERSDVLDRLVQAGLVAYGVVHILIGWLTLQLALGDRSEEASASGAMSELAQQPFGKVAVWAVAIGMLLLVVWRVIEAGFGHRDAEEGAERLRKRATSGLKAVLYGAIGFSAFKVALGSGSSGGGGGGGSDGMTAKLMGLPGGPVIVVLVGLAVIGYAGNLAWRGWKEKFAEHLETEGKLGNAGAAYLILGKVGHLAKGAALAIVGGLFVYAGVTHDAQESGGLDEALKSLLDEPFGPVLLMLIAVGLAAYGVFCFARARHLDR